MQRIYNIIHMVINTFNIPTSNVNISATAAMKLNNNPAYKTQTSLQENMVYENTNFTTSNLEVSQALTNTEELAYEIVPLISSQPTSTTGTTQMLSNREGDSYNKLTRDIVQQK